jgi:predicted NAD/FAD-binding protein
MQRRSFIIQYIRKNERSVRQKDSTSLLKYLKNNNMFIKILFQYFVTPLFASITASKRFRIDFI